MEEEADKKDWKEKLAAGENFLAVMDRLDVNIQ